MNKKNLFTLFICLASCLVFADKNYEQQLQDLKNSAKAVKIPQVPVYDIRPISYKRYGFVSLFVSTRLSDGNFTTQVMSDFPLNQVQMVGFMQDANINYGLFKTPYETLMLKTGDKIKSGIITTINESGAVITEYMVNASGGSYQKIVNLKFDNTNNNVKLKLQ